MENTYTETVHYRIIIEGDYSICSLLKEELDNDVNDLHDLVWEFIANNITDYYPPKMELTNLKIEKEQNK